MTRKSFDTPHRVTFEDTNAIGNVYYTNYFSWQGRCRELFLLEYAPDTLAELGAGRLRMVTAHASCDFAEEFALCDDVVVRMTLLRPIPFGVSLGFEYCKATGEGIFARGRQDIKFLRNGASGWELTAIPDSLRKALREFE